VKFAIGRFGRPIAFDPAKWGSGGDFEPQFFIFWLAMNFPQHEIFVISPSDGIKVFGDRIKNLHFIPPRKIIPFAAYQEILGGKNPQAEKEMEESISLPFRWLENEGIDHAFMFAGVIYGKNFPFSSKTKKGKWIRPQWSAISYSCPLIDYLNRSDIRWHMIATDIRHIRKNATWGIMSELVNSEMGIAAQEDWILEYRKKHLSRPRRYKGDSAAQPMKGFLIYSGFETLAAAFQSASLEKDFFSHSKSGAKIKIFHSAFDLFSKSASPFDLPRYEKLRKYGILDRNDVEIFGSWPEGIALAHPGVFKGPIPRSALGAEISSAGYSIIFGDKMATSKFLEIAFHGCIPLAEHSWASNCPSLPYALDFLRFSSKEELFEKIAEMESSESLKKSILERLHGICFKDFDFQRGGYFKEKFEKAAWPIELGEPEGGSLKFNLWGAYKSMAAGGDLGDFI
jgi:hypothetical protein